MILCCHGHLGYGSPSGGKDYWSDHRGSIVSWLCEQLQDEQVAYTDMLLPGWWSRGLSAKCQELTRRYIPEIPKIAEAPSVHIITHSLGVHVGEALACRLAQVGEARRANILQEQEPNPALGHVIHINPWRWRRPKASRSYVLYTSNDILSGKWYHGQDSSRDFSYSSDLPWWKRHKEPVHSHAPWKNLAAYLR